LKPVYGRSEQGTELQTDGDYRKMLSILAMPFCWIWRVYEVGSDHSQGSFKWSDENGNDYFWNASSDVNLGNCPLKVTLASPPSASSAENGRVVWEMTLTSTALLTEIMPTYTTAQAVALGSSSSTAG